MMRHSFFRNNRSPVAVRGEVGVPLRDGVSTDGMDKNGWGFFLLPQFNCGDVSCESTRLKTIYRNIQSDNERLKLIMPSEVVFI